MHSQAGRRTTALHLPAASQREDVAMNWPAFPSRGKLLGSLWRELVTADMARVNLAYGSILNVNLKRSLKRKPGTD